MVKKASTSGIHPAMKMLEKEEIPPKMPEEEMPMKMPTKTPETRPPKDQGLPVAIAEKSACRTGK